MPCGPGRVNRPRVQSRGMWVLLGYSRGIVPVESSVTPGVSIVALWRK